MSCNLFVHPAAVALTLLALGLAGCASPGVSDETSPSVDMSPMTSFSPI